MSVGTTTIGHGSKLSIGSGGAGETWTDIACQSISFGSNKVDTHDVTDMLTTGNVRQSIGGLETPGDITIKAFLKIGDTAQAALFTAKDAAVHDFKVTFPGATRTESGPGIIESWDEEVPDDKPATLTVKIKKAGAWTVV